VLEETLVTQIVDKLNVNNEPEQKLIEKTLETLEQLGMLNLPYQGERQGANAQSGTFALSLKEYLKMDFEEQKRVQLKAYEEHQDWIEQELRLRNAEWMVVCNGKIIRDSQRLNDYPSDDELMKIGKKFNRIPFVFVKTPLIEETPWAQVSPWDYYPTVEILLGKADWDKEELLHKGEVIIADLDTGCPYIFTSYDEALAKRYILPSPFRHAQARYHLGIRYLFYIATFTIGVQDANGKLKCQNMAIHCVENWPRSPFCHINPERKALVGRNLFLEFLLTLKLSGRTKSSVICCVNGNI